MGEITTEEVREYLKKIEGQVVGLDTLRKEFNILQGSKSFDAIRNIMFRLAKEGLAKPLTNGKYKVIIQVDPVKWWEELEDENPLDFKFPKSYHDDTTFGIENLVEVYAGDLILISGQTNFGKTAMALSILGENIDLLVPLPRLMGSEYTGGDDKASPKFKRRMKRMDWVQWMNGNGEPRFELYPVGADYEEYVKRNAINAIDWVSIPNGEYYLIDAVTKAIKDRVGRGVSIVVLQMNPGAEYGEGGPRSERYVDVALKIKDFGEGQSLLTIGKVKAPKGRSPSGRNWAFEIVDYGANFANIREVVKCGACYGKGWAKNMPCPACNKLGYVDKKKS